MSAADDIDGTDVAFEVGARGEGEQGATDSSFLTKDGFENVFRLTSMPVDAGPLPGFAVFDDALSVKQAAVVGTDGERYVLVTLTGFGLRRDAVQKAAALAKLLAQSS